MAFEAAFGAASSLCFSTLFERVYKRRTQVGSTPTATLRHSKRGSLASTWRQTMLLPVPPVHSAPPPKKAGERPRNSDARTAIPQPWICGRAILAAQGSGFSIPAPDSRDGGCLALKWRNPIGKSPHRPPTFRGEPNGSFGSGQNAQIGPVFDLSKMTVALFEDGN